jgi:hypothetical protein
MAHIARYGVSPRLRNLTSIGFLWFGLLLNANGQQAKIAPAISGEHSGVSEKTVIDMSAEELRQSYPGQLKALKFDPNQSPLDDLLKKTGESVLGFFRDFANVSAKERVEMLRKHKVSYDAESRTFTDCTGLHTSSEGDGRVEEYQYLILAGKNGASWAEDRTDKKNRPVNLNEQHGFMLSAGYARYSLYLHPSHQANSSFRYLGRETNPPGAHVIAFVQKPEAKDYLGEYFESGVPTPIGLLVQGFVWIDPDSHQILRMYTRLLSPERPIKLKGMTADIVYGKVLLGDGSRVSMLPQEIHVDWDMPFCKCTNRHKYSDYHLFSVQSDYRITQPDAKQ